MPTFSFLVRETLKRDRVYSLEAKDFDEAEKLLDGFKTKVTESVPKTGENIDVDDYDIKECWQRVPTMHLGDPIRFAEDLDSKKEYVIADILGDHVIIGRRQKKGLLFIDSIKRADLEWTEYQKGAITSNFWLYNGPNED